MKRGSTKKTSSPKQSDELPTTPPFYCNICRKDISFEPRIKCLSCKNFDLCIDCFRVGAEIFPHEATHPYIIIEKLDFPLFKPDWLAIEEVLLLDAIATSGLGNWEAAAQNLGSKTADECRDHYYEVYFGSKCAPLPDPLDIIPGSPHTLQEMHAQAIATKPRKRSERVKETTPITIENFPRVQYHPWETAAGYNPLRGEFSTEWNAHVEDDLHTLSFLPTDSENDRVIKYNALTAYYKIIQERSRRTRLIVERNLLQYSATESWDKSTLLGMGAGAADAAALATRLRVFMQIMAREEFKCLLEGIAQDRRVCTEIARLKALRARGGRTLAGLASSTASSAPPPAPPPGKKARHEHSVAGLPGAHLLGDDERRLCEERRLAPHAYLALKALAVREQQTAGAVSAARVIAAAQQPRDVVEAALAFFHRAGWIARPADDARDAKTHKKKKHRHRDSKDQAAAAAVAAAAASVALGTAPGIALPPVPPPTTGTTTGTTTSTSGAAGASAGAGVSVVVPSVGARETKPRHRAGGGASPAPVIPDYFGAAAPPSQLPVLPSTSSTSSTSSSVAGATSTATAAALAAAAALDSVGAGIDAPLAIPGVPTLPPQGSQAPPPQSLAF